jgi:hypothetical protein
MYMKMAGNKLGGVGRTARVGSFGRVGCLLLALAGTGCDGGDPGPMSGRQLLTGRDISDLFFWKERTLAFTRDTADTSQPEPQDFVVWPLDDPAPSVALTGVRWSSPASWPLWVAGELMMTGTQLERVYDIGNREEANLLADFPSPGGSAGEEITFRSLLASTAMRSDGHGLAKLLRGSPQAIVLGRPPELRAFTMPDGASVGSITFIGTDLALLVRQTTADGDVVGIQRLDASSGALTPLVAPTPAAEWTGVTGFCDDVEPPARCGFFGTVGCGIAESACPDGKPTPCLILYAKVDPDAAPKTAAYVYDLSTGTSSKLAGAEPDHFFADGTNKILAWGSATNHVTNYWNMCSGARGECPFSGDLVAWRPDGGAFAVYGPGDFMRLVDVAGASCIQPSLEATFSVYQVQYSPGSDRVWWIAATDLAETSQTLWLAGAYAQSPVAVTSGPFLGGSFSPDGQRIYVSHAAESSALGWIDVNTSPPVEKILSTNRGDIGVLGNRRAVFVDHFNAQDRNGELVLVEVETGASQLLARAVTSVAVSGRAGAEGTDVAYAVRGRAGSSRDGLWLTTLPP